MRHKVVVRKAKPTDVDAMKALWIEFVDFHRDCDPVFQRASDGHEQFGRFVAERIKRPDWCVLVALVEEAIVGHIMGTIESRPPVFVNLRFGYVQDIAVAAEYRRTGIGRALFARLVRWFKNADIDHIELDVATANPASIGFWRQMGCRDFMMRLSRDI
jgi:ribosomal protein S18 acetylase RimI-like enzyme